MLRRVFDNPIFVKHVRSRLRRTQLVSHLVVVLIVAAILLWGGLVVGESARPLPILLGMQGVILLLGGTMQVASATSAARESGILEFHRASPLPAFDIALGFLLGAPVREHLLSLAVVPLAAIAALRAPAGLVGYGLLYLLLLVGALLFHSLAMIAGLVGPRRGNFGVGIVVLCYILAPTSFAGIALPGVLTMTPACLEMTGMGNLGAKPRFFGIDLPMIAQSFLYQIPFFVLALVCCVRRMSAADRPLYSKAQGIAVLVVVGGLSLATVVNSTDAALANAAPLALAIALGATAMVLALAVTPDRGSWANGIRRATRLGRSRPSVWHDWAANSLIIVVYGIVVAAFGALAFALSAAATRAADAAALRHTLRLIAVPVLTILYFGWALQYFHLRFGRRAPTLFGVFLFFVWVVPLLLGAVLALQFHDATTAWIRDLSPLFGVFTGSPSAVLGALVPAIVVGCLLQLAIRQGEGRLAADQLFAESA